MRLAAWIITGKVSSEEISGEATNLMVASRKSSTNSNYTSSWCKWTSWCDKRQIDSFWCDVKWILNYPDDLFQEGYTDYLFTQVCNFSLS